jgi:hypothetical protein
LERRETRDKGGGGIVRERAAGLSKIEFCEIENVWDRSRRPPGIPLLIGPKDAVLAVLAPVDLVVRHLSKSPKDLLGLEFADLRIASAAEIPSGRCIAATTTSST